MLSSLLIGMFLFYVFFFHLFFAFSINYLLCIINNYCINIYITYLFAGFLFQFSCLNNSMKIAINEVQTK